MARRGRRFQYSSFEARLFAADSGRSRIGLIVPKHGQSAVRRNRLKRQLREWVRLNLLPALTESDKVQPMEIVIRARGPAYEATASDMREEFAKIVSSIVRFGTKRE